MGPDESDELGERLLVLRREFGLTMLVIEHHVPLVLRVCDHVYVLNFGRLLAEGRPSVIQTHPEVVAAYLGGEAPEALAATERDRGGRRARRPARAGRRAPRRRRDRRAAPVAATPRRRARRDEGRSRAHAHHDDAPARASRDHHAPLDADARRTSEA